jgi:autotransporter translocation and assembly factor TamB
LNGTIGKSATDIVDVAFQKFKLSHLNPSLRGAGLTLNGIMDGTAAISEVYQDVQLRTKLEIDQLLVNGDTLGDASIQSGFDNSKKEIMVDVKVVRGTAKIIDITGSYDVSKKEDNMNFHLVTDNFYLHTLETMMDGLVHNVRGKVSLDLTIKGSLNQPEVEGTADFVKAAATIDYLNTRYNFTSKVVIRKNEFDLSH